MHLLTLRIARLNDVVHIRSRRGAFTQISCVSDSGVHELFRMAGHVTPKAGDHLTLAVPNPGRLWGAYGWLDHKTGDVVMPAYRFECFKLLFLSPFVLVLGPIFLCGAWQLRHSAWALAMLGGGLLPYVITYFALGEFLEFRRAKQALQAEASR